MGIAVNIIAGDSELYVQNDTKPRLGLFATAQVASALTVND